MPYHRSSRRADRDVRSMILALDCVEVQTGPEPRASIIWMHGLGADGHDIEPVVPEIVRPGERALRFLFPHAPVRPVTINAGYAMRAWYDIASLDRGTREDESGILASCAEVRALIARENSRGIETRRIVLAGFSQGGALALYAGLTHPERLAGVLALSCYLPLAPRFASERTAANQPTPVFLAHGTVDTIVDPVLGQESRLLLEAAGYRVDWHEYDMPHSVSREELADIAAWLRRIV